MSETQNKADVQPPEGARLNELFVLFGEKYKVNPETVGILLQRTAFKQSDNSEISKPDMISLLVVAHTYNLNPFTREIYAFPDKGRVVPVVGVDGWSRIINDQVQFDGMDFKYAETSKKFNNKSLDCEDWIECQIYRKDRLHPVVVREYLAETYRDTAQWNSKTRRMLRHKAMIQCARYAFGLVGISEADEVEYGIQARTSFEEAQAAISAANPPLKGGLEQARREVAGSLAGTEEKPAIPALNPSQGEPAAATSGKAPTTSGAEAEPLFAD